MEYGLLYLVYSLLYLVYMKKLIYEVNLDINLFKIYLNFYLMGSIINDTTH
jgi:hypothetical protein